MVINRSWESVKMSLNDQQHKFGKLSLTGIILSLVGSIITLIGLFIPIRNYINEPDRPGLSLALYSFNINGEYYFGFNMIALPILVLIIAIIILTVFRLKGAKSNSNLVIRDERPVMFGIFTFLFAPIIVPIYYTSSFYYIIDFCTYSASYIAYSKINPAYTQYGIGAGFFFVIPGIILLMIAFFILTLAYFWRKRSDTIQRIEQTVTTNFEEGKTTKFARKGLAAVTIVASLGLILAISTPIFRDVYRTTPPAPTDVPERNFLLPYRYYSGSYQVYMDFTVLCLIVILTFVMAAAILLLIGTLTKNKIPTSIAPLLIMVLIPIAIPWWAPYSGGRSIWQSSFLELLWIYDDFYYHARNFALHYRLGNIDNFRALSVTTWFGILGLGAFYVITPAAIGLSLWDRKKMNVLIQAEREYLAIAATTAKTEES